MAFSRHRFHLPTAPDECCSVADELLEQLRKDIEAVRDHLEFGNRIEAGQRATRARDRATHLSLVLRGIDLPNHVRPFRQPRTRP